MHSSARHVAHGRHATVIAIPSETSSGWTVVKVIYGPKSGRTEGSKPHDAVREVNILRSLNHPNVVSLLEYQYHPDLFEHHVHLPLLPLSLADLLDRPLATELIRSITYQALSALAYIHGEGIAHRDVNPHNVMLDWDGTLKLIDFGIAYTGGDDITEDDGVIWRETNEEMICSVGTGYWRAPELLFSPTTYDAFALDLWGLGVVITDLHTRSDESESLDTDSRSEEADGDSDSSFDPLDEVPSNNEKPRRRLFNDTFGDVGLAASIFQILGTPTPETWPDFKTLPDAEKIEFRPTDPVSLASLFPDMDPQLVDLVGGLLQLSPGRRVQAKDALGHACFDRTLVPSASVYADARCLEVVDGRRLSDHISDELKVKREQWQPASQ